MAEPPHARHASGGQVLEAFVTALVDGDHDRLRASVAAVEATGVAPTQLYSRLFAPAMARLGELWASGTISTAHEHVASAQMERLLAENYPRVFLAPRASREQVLLACVPGERHVLALRMSADLLEGSGYRVTFLGADPRLEDLLDAARREQPAAIVLAAEADGALAALAEVVRALHDLRPETPVIVGGEVASRLDRTALAGPVTAVDEVDEIVAAVQRAVGQAGGDSV